MTLSGIVKSEKGISKCKKWPTKQTVIKLPRKWTTYYETKYVHILQAPTTK